MPVQDGVRYTFQGVRNGDFIPSDWSISKKRGVQVSCPDGATPQYDVTEPVYMGYAEFDGNRYAVVFFAWLSSNHVHVIVDDTQVIEVA